MSHSGFRHTIITMLLSSANATCCCCCLTVGFLVQSSVERAARAVDKALGGCKLLESWSTTVVVFVCKGTNPNKECILQPDGEIVSNPQYGDCQEYVAPSSLWSRCFAVVDFLSLEVLNLLERPLRISHHRLLGLGRTSVALREPAQPRRTMLDGLDIAEWTGSIASDMRLLNGDLCFLFFFRLAMDHPSLTLRVTRTVF